MRLKSSIWTSAYLRLCQHEGAYAAVRRRGDDDAGAIFIKINRLDGRAEIFGPAPQSVFGEGRPEDRAFIRTFGAAPVADGAAEERLASEITYDPDIWIIEVEDRQGRHFLEWVAEN